MLFRSVGIQVTVRVHALNVHLVWVTTHAFIFGIITSGVLNDGILEQGQQGLVVFSVDGDFQSVHAALSSLIGPHLDGTIGGQVAAECAQVLTVIVLDDQDGGVDVLLHLVGKVAQDVVVGILEALDLGEEWDFMV